VWDKESNHSIGSWVLSGCQFREGYADSWTISLSVHMTFYELQPLSCTVTTIQHVTPAGYQSGRGTPMSQLYPSSDVGLLYTSQLMEIGSRPPTNYFDMLTVRLLADYGAPSDADLERSIGEILWSGDLNTVAKMCA